MISVSFCYWKILLGAVGALIVEGLRTYVAGPSYWNTSEVIPIVFEKSAEPQRQMQLASTSTVAVAPVPEAEPSPWRTKFADIVRTWGELQVLKRDEEDARDTAELAERAVTDFRARAIVGRIAISGILDVKLREELMADMDKEEKDIVGFEKDLPDLYIFLARVRDKIAVHERTLSVEFARRPHLMNFFRGFPESRASLEEEPPPRRLLSF